MRVQTNSRTLTVTAPCFALGPLRRSVHIDKKRSNRRGITQVRTLRVGRNDCFTMCSVLLLRQFSDAVDAYRQLALGSTNTLALNYSYLLVSVLCSQLVLLQLHHFVPLA